MHHIRARFYLIAASLLDQPNNAGVERVRGLIDGLLSESLLDTPWRRMLESLAHDPDVEQVSEVEYNRLFVLSFPHAAVQPYGSYWLEQDRRLLGASALEVREMMAAHGLAVREESGLMPDHIVSELEFMAYLASQGDTALTAQEQLLDRHLARWVPKFTAALSEARPSPYYRLAADFLDRLIQWDQVRLPRIKEQSEQTSRSSDPGAGEQG